MSAVEARPERESWLDVPWPEEWAARGRCRTAPSSLFFPRPGESHVRAKEVCAGCAVLQECRAYALTHRGLVGVWAGLTDEERRQLRVDAMEAAFHPSEERTERRRANAAGTLYRTLAELTGHPQRWARVAHYGAAHSAPSMASRLRKGRDLVPPGRWRFEGRVNAAGGSDLYAYLEEAS